MSTNSSQQPQYPYPGQQQPVAPPPRNTGKVIRTIIVAACLVAVAVIAVVVVARNHSNDDAAKGPASPDGGTVHRAGYTDDSSIADPAPIKDSAPSATVTYRGARVVQACNLLTLADLQRLGVRLDTNPLPNTVNFERHYLAADGTSPLSASSNGFASGDTFAANKCNFSFLGSQNSPEYLGIAVSQKQYVPGAALNLGYAAESYVRKANIGDVVVYSHRDKADHPDDARGDAVLRLRDVTVNVTFDLTAKGVAPKLTAIATAIGKNISAQVAAPQGPRSVDYSSPAFPKSVAQPCQLLSPAAFTDAYHMPASPLVTENPGTAVGTTKFPNDSQPYNYVQVSCERGTGQDDPGARQALWLQTTSYLSDIPAKKNVDFGRTHHNGRPAAVTLGDESTVETGGDTPATNGALIFRKGRFVFELRIADENHYPRGLTPPQVNSILVPAAQRILQRLGHQT
jgi:hypothetical protein